MVTTFVVVSYILGEFTNNMVKACRKFSLKYANVIQNNMNHVL